jgi:hypothetical protein
MKKNRGLRNFSATEQRKNLPVKSQGFSPCLGKKSPAKACSQLKA